MNTPRFLPNSPMSSCMYTGSPDFFRSFTTERVRKTKVYINRSYAVTTNITRSNEKSAKTDFWKEEETNFMLQQMKTLNIVYLVDGRKYRNGNTFQKLSFRMSETKITGRVHLTS